MALRFMDGADHYTTVGSFLQKWTAATQNFFTTAGRRAGSNALGIGASGVNNTPGTVTKTMDHQSTWVVAGAFKSSTLAGPIPCQFMDNTTEQLSVRVSSAGALFFTRGGVTIGTTPDGTIMSGIWFHLQIRVTIADAGGRFVVKLNDVTVFDFTGDTKNTANATADRIILTGPAQVSQNLVVDDLYVLDGTGSTPYNDLIGDLRIDTLFPTAEGNYSDWTPSTGTNNAALVDEATPNSDTDYISSETVGHKDSFTVGDLPAETVTVYATQVVVDARKDDVGTRTIRPIYRVGGADYNGGDMNVIDSYAAKFDLLTASPATAAAWTPSEINALEVGVELVA